MLLDIQIFSDIQKELDLFFSNLNWAYIFMYTITLFGIKHKPEFYWYNNLIDKNKTLKNFKVWIAGFLIMMVFVTFYYLEHNKITPLYCSQMLRSFIIVTVFNSLFVEKARQIEDKLDGDDDENDKKKD